jgi:anti-anti-sigma factor
MSRFDAAASMLLHPAGRSLHKRLRYSEETLINKARSTRSRPRFESEVEHHLGLVVVRLKGELDITHVHKLEALHPQTAEPTPVMLDLRELTFIDLSAFRQLLDAKRQSDQRGRPLALSGASGAVRRLFDLMGVQHLLSDPIEVRCAS